MTDTPRDCAHGALARSCDRCADAREIAGLRAEVERLRSTPRASPPPMAISALMSGPLIDSLSSRHTYTEAEVRLVIAGMQAEIDAATALADDLHAEVERLKVQRDAAGANAAAALGLVSRIRWALGGRARTADQGELVEIARGMGQIARGELVHRNAGDCPDETRPHQRDPQCQACRVIW